LQRHLYEISILSFHKEHKEGGKNLMYFTQMKLPPLFLEKPIEACAYSKTGRHGG
jgi:hypothetical protein